MLYTQPLDSCFFTTLAFKASPGIFPPSLLPSLHLSISPSFPLSFFLSSSSLSTCSSSSFWPSSSSFFFPPSPPPPCKWLKPGSFACKANTVPRAMPASFYSEASLSSPSWPWTLRFMQFQTCALSLSRSWHHKPMPPDTAFLFTCSLRTYVEMPLVHCQQWKQGGTLGKWICPIPDTFFSVWLLVSSAWNRWGRGWTLSPAALCASPVCPWEGVSQSWLKQDRREVTVLSRKKT